MGIEYEDLDFNPRSIAASPDGETMAVGAYLTTYTHLLYDGRILDVNASHRHSVDDIGFSPDGSILGIGVTLGGVSLIDVEDKQEIMQLHGGYDNRLSFSPDGKHSNRKSRRTVMGLGYRKRRTGHGTRSASKGFFLC
jgi:WD40 repeat protein